MEQKGVKELLEVVDCCVSMVNAGVMVAKDKKISFDDLTVLFMVVPKLVPAIEGVKEIPAEIKDMSTAEAAAVVAEVGAKLAIDNEKAKAVVENSLKTLLAVKDLIDACIELKKA